MPTLVLGGSLMDKVTFFDFFCVSLQTKSAIVTFYGGYLNRNH